MNTNSNSSYINVTDDSLEQSDSDLSDEESPTLILCEPLQFTPNQGVFAHYRLTKTKKSSPKAQEYETPVSTEPKLCEKRRNSSNDEEISAAKVQKSWDHFTPPKMSPPEYNNFPSPKMSPSEYNNFPPPKMSPSEYNNFPPPKMSPSEYNNFPPPKMSPPEYNNFPPPKMSPPEYNNFPPPKMSPPEYNNFPPPKMSPPEYNNFPPPKMSPSEYNFPPPVLSSSEYNFPPPILNSSEYHNNQLTYLNQPNPPEYFPPPLEPNNRFGYQFQPDIGGSFRNVTQQQNYGNQVAEYNCCSQPGNNFYTNNGNYPAQMYM